MKNEEIWQLVDAKRDLMIALADRVWGMPELCYSEHRSAAEHAAMLEREGFRVTTGAAGIPTAVIGEAGEGGPVIAILGEVDALPGLSQEAGVAEPRPVEAGGNGHGCGHNPPRPRPPPPAPPPQDLPEGNPPPGPGPYQRS